MTSFVAFLKTCSFDTPLHLGRCKLFYIFSYVLLLFRWMWGNLFPKSYILFIYSHFCFLINIHFQDKFLNFWCTYERVKGSSPPPPLPLLKLVTFVSIGWCLFTRVTYANFNIAASLRNVSLNRTKGKKRFYHSP